LRGSQKNNVCFLKKKLKKRPKEKREIFFSNLYDPLYWLGSMVLRNQNTNPKKKKTPEWNLWWRHLKYRLRYPMLLLG
jgi:hypothetical protein